VTPPSDPLPSGFADDLAAELAAFEFFSALLDTEHDALLAGDADAVVRIATAKGEQVAQLAALAERRLAALRQSGFTADRKGMAQWLLVAAGSRASELSSRWNALLDIAARAQQLNERNGALIQARMAFNQAALAALRSATPPADLAYGPDGITRLGAVPGRDLGSA
jgi:flagella synthesis protein FlgN